MEGVEAHPALHHAETGDRGVDPAGEQQQSLTGRTVGHPPGTGKLTRVDVRRLIAHLDPHGDIGIVEIDAQMGAEL